MHNYLGTCVRHYRIKLFTYIPGTSKYRSLLYLNTPVPSDVDAIISGYRLKSIVRTTYY